MFARQRRYFTPRQSEAREANENISLERAYTFSATYNKNVIRATHQFVPRPRVLNVDHAAQDKWKGRQEIWQGPEEHLKE